jgi:putative Holliday junction resolvase
VAKVFALDIGEKRIGIASSDELEIIAAPFGFVERKEGVEELGKIFKSKNAEKVVIGMPYLPSGGLGSQAEDVKKFIEEFKQKIDLPVVLENEVLTSKEAEKRFKDAGKRNVLKGEIDALAATIILEQYLRREK